MVLGAAFAELLARTADLEARGVSDVLTGTAVAGRDHAALEPLIGFFVNTLVLRHRLDDRETVGGRLAQTRKTVLAAFEHSALPFEKVVDAVAVRDPGRSPIFQVMLVWQNAPVREPAFDGLSTTPYGRDRAVAKFDLTLNLFGAGRRDCGFPGIQHRPLRGVHGRDHGAAVGAPAAGLCGRARGQGLDAEPIGRGGAASCGFVGAARPRPGSAGRVDPRAFRALGRATTRCHGPGAGGSVHDLRRAQWAGQCPGPPLGGPGHEARVVRGHCRAPVHGDRGGRPGHPQSGRGLCAPGSGPARSPPAADNRRYGPSTMW